MNKRNPLRKKRFLEAKIKSRPSNVSTAGIASKPPAATVARRLRRRRQARIFPCFVARDPANKLGGGGVRVSMALFPCAETHSKLEWSLFLLKWPNFEQFFTIKSFKKNTIIFHFLKRLFFFFISKRRVAFV